MKKKLDRGLNPMKRPLRSSYVFFCVFFVFFLYFFVVVVVCVVVLERNRHMKERTTELK